MDVVQFAFEVYQHKERSQHESPTPRDFMKSMLVAEFLTALVKGAMASASVGQDDHLSSIDDVPKILDEFVALWSNTCGLDFSISSREHELADGQEPPLTFCWRTKQQAGLPTVEFLLNRGYKPCFWLVCRAWGDAEICFSDKCAMIQKNCISDISSDMTTWFHSCAQYCVSDAGDAI
jgi:hypothetical protein